MAKYLERHVIGEVKHIKLETDTVSVYARTQTETGRICTIEAVALLLQEMGESESVCKGLISAVVVNNNALRPKKIGNLYETGRGKFHQLGTFTPSYCTNENGEKFRQLNKDKRRQREQSVNLYTCECTYVRSFSVESIEKYYYMKRKLCAYVYKLSSLDLNFYFDLAPRLLTAFIFDFILFFDSRSLATLFFAKFMRIIF